MCAGVRAAKVIHEALGKRGTTCASDFRKYEATTRAMIRRLKPFVYGYYDPVFTEAFCSEAPYDQMRAAVVSTLSGDVVAPSLRVRFWRTAMLLSVQMLRLTRRFQPPPVAQPA
jgi:hypothetical protein